MSRTYRRKSHRVEAKEKLNKDGTVRDGTYTHYSTGCERHGTCPWCADGRQHKHKRRELVEGE